MTLNLDADDGRTVFEDLVAISDVLVENNPVSTLTKLGIDYPWLRNIRPDLIAVRMPPYGLQGPYRNFRSVGSSLEAVMGHTSIRGYRDTDPSMTSSVYTADASAGANAAFAVVSALLFRRESGFRRLDRRQPGPGHAPLPRRGPHGLLHELPSPDHPRKCRPLKSAPRLLSLPRGRPMDHNLRGQR